MNGSRGRFLVIEDDAALARTLARTVGSYGDAVIAPSVREAQRLLANAGGWRGLLVDVGLPDGSGLTVLSWTVRRGLRLPAIVLTGTIDRDVMNEAVRLRAAVLLKPVSWDILRAFLREATAGMGADRLAGAVRCLVDQYHLSEAECDVIERAVRGGTLETIASDRGCALLTVRKHIANILLKTMDDSFALLVQRMLREALGPHGPSSDRGAQLRHAHRRVDDGEPYCS